MAFEPSLLPLRIGESLRDTTNSRLLHAVDILGEGAYATVYLVRESKSHRLYALKCLSKHGLTWEQLNLQREEAKMHKMLVHKNVVLLERYFENRDWLFLVMEYCPGTDLFDWISERRDYYDGKRKRTEAERTKAVNDVFSQALDAVAYCHQRGVFHRDIKPENFIVCNDGTVKLTDFGLATLDRVSDDFDCGSKPYMSYECRVEATETYSPRLGDIWSLGVLLLTLLHRRTPWAEAHPDCVEYARFVKDPIDFLKREFGCDYELAQFLSKRVFCPASRRVSLDEFARRWREGLLLHTAPIKVRQGKHMRRESPWRPEVSQLRKLLGQIQASSAPSEPQVKRPVPRAMDLISTSWSDLAESEMDFSAPVIFDEESTDVEDDNFANVITAPTPIRAIATATTAMSVATAVGSVYLQASLSSDEEPPVPKHRNEVMISDDEEDIFAMHL